MTVLLYILYDPWAVVVELLNVYWLEAPWWLRE